MSLKNRLDIFVLKTHVQTFIFIVNKHVSVPEMQNKTFIYFMDFMFLFIFIYIYF